MTDVAAQWRWSDIPEEIVTPLLSRRLISGDNLTIARVRLSAGCPIPQHAHVHEQMTHVVEGCLRFWVDGSAGYRDVGAGEVIHFPSNLPHRAEALEDTVVIDVFTPVREDWVRGTDSYLRG